MSSHRLGVAWSFVGSFMLASMAWADVPPPEGYVETCTVADQQTAGTECLVCFSTRGLPNRCEPLLVPYCFASVCHAWSGSNEVWCRTRGAGVPQVPSQILDVLRPVDFPLPPAIDGGVAAAPSSCLPFTPSAAGGRAAASADSTGAGKTGGSSGCTVGGWVSAKSFIPWLTAGLFAGLLTLMRRRRL